MAVRAPAHRFSSAEYTRLVDSGALEGVAVELLDGEMVDVSPQSAEHALAIQRLTVLFAARVELLRVRLPLETGEGSVPEPDVALAEPSPDPRRHPATALLVVEVAVSSQAVDERKAATYAGAGIPAYWVVDLPADRVLEHTGPTRAGYARTAERTSDDVLDPGVLGVAPVTVAALLGD